MATAWHILKTEQVLAELKTTASGISEDEARGRLKKYGPNEIEKKKPPHPLAIFARQFKSFLIVVLIAAAVISAALGYTIDAAVILVILIMNAVIGFVQEYRAQHALEELAKLAAPLARVVRAGHERLISARELVPGDIVIIDTGDRIPADMRLIEIVNLKTDEAALTGESVPVVKSLDLLEEETPLPERRNMVFAGTLATYGRASGVVIATGMSTEFGKIAKMIAAAAAEEKKTPLQIKMAQTGKTIGLAVVGICAVIFAVGILREWFFAQLAVQKIQELFLIAVSLAVAAVPEGLPAIITITLALGLQRMARRNAIVRRLPAVETLGCTTIIAADKTGTLTKNEMTVRRIFVNDQVIAVSGEGWAPEGKFTTDGETINPAKDSHLALALKIGALCNTAKLYAEDKVWRVAGDPTEGALLVAAAKAGMPRESLKDNEPEIAEIPFDSIRKRMTTIHAKGKGEKVGRIAYVKGAPEIILAQCSHIYKGGRIKVLAAAEKEKILTANKDFATGALRVLGLAYKPLSPRIKEFSADKIETELIFVGLVGMIDPPRPEVKGAIELCRSAGIRPIMLTGDHGATAAAIGRELGIIAAREDATHEKDKILTGLDIEKMSDADLQAVVDEVAIYARISPEHKVRIVKALKAKGHTVAVTGDGINDAPALQQADIGVAMGIKGTDVTKEASDMVLQDDNFATIVEAVKQGRGVYENIKKSIAYLLSGNISEVLIIFSAILAGLPLPLIAIQILWINLITDGVPALALSVDPIDAAVMARPPRKKDESVFKGLKPFLVGYPVIVLAGVLAIFISMLPLGLVKAQTAAFTAIVFYELFQSFSCRSLEKPVGRGIWSNKYLLAAVVALIGLQLAILYLPFLQVAFHTAALTAADWLLILPAAATGFVYLEAHKWWASRSQGRTSTAL